MFNRPYLALALAALLFVNGCNQEASKEDGQTAQNQSGKGINPANIDTTVAPCENFFLFANGGWLKNNPIPAAESRWGSFNELADRNSNILHNLLEEASGNPNTTQGGIAQKVGDYYYSGMDSLGIEKAGISPLQEEFDKITAVKDTRSLLDVLARHQRRDINSVLNTYVGQDRKNSSKYILYASQGGLGLPDRDYYLKEDARSKDIREAYVKHIQQMFALAGQDSLQAKSQAQTVLNLETRLAKASMPRVDLRDPYKTYHKYSVAELNKLTPNLNWPYFFQQLGASQVDSVIVGQPDFFKEVNKMLNSVTISDWQTYLRWQLLRSAAPALPYAFVKANFDFYNAKLGGAKEMQPRWKRISRATDGAMGEALGQLYVEKAFSPEAKQKALEMVNNLRAAFKEHIDQLDWMSDSTKQRALEKLNAFAVKIGYPDKWKDYSKLAVDRNSYVTNMMRANEFEFERDIQKLGQPIDRTEWGMSPPTVNAYYRSTLNEIVFPAGILQPPFFDPEADDAVNYGGMGAVIGHELTHGFDDQGSKYDAQGNLRDWWSPVDAESFIKRATVVADQFSGYKVLDSIPVNGKLTLGENIADLGGLAIAYTALQKALQDKNPGKIDGFTPEQRFFLAWAQIWRTNARDEYLSQQVIVDPHAPAQYRVNGPLSNLPQFYEAFGCTPNSPMVRGDSLQAQIW